MQATTSEIDVATMATVNELKNAIDSWMKNRFNIDVDFDAQLALKHLEEFGLLTVRNLGKLTRGFVIRHFVSIVY